MPANQAYPVATDPATADACAGTSARTEQDLAVLTLDDGGMIRDCNRESESLFKYRRDELLGRHISLLLPQLAALELIRDGRLNPHLRARCRLGCHFQAATRDGEHFVIDLFLNLLGSGEDKRLSVIVRRTEEVGHVAGLDATTDSNARGFRE